MKRTQRMKQIRSLTPMMHAGSEALNFSITLIRLYKHIRAAVPSHAVVSLARSRAQCAVGRRRRFNRGDWRRLVWNGRRFVKC